jgi:type IV pilus assembly protein PilN
MYSLDINFLNDRPEYSPDKGRGAARGGGRSRAPANPDDKRPLFLGAALGLAALAASGGAFLFFSTQNASLEAQQQELDGKLGDLEAKQKEVANVETEIKQIKDESTALASVFNTIKPWSALMQDVRERIPANVQILTVKQAMPVAGAAPAAKPAGAAGAPTLPVADPVLIGGVATGFNDVNDFLLVLQKSNFVKADETKLIKAALETEDRKLEPIKLENIPGLGGTNTIELPKIPKQVVFSIQVTLTDVTASELLRELDRKGAVGLVTRIEALQQKGVIQK